MPTDDRSIDDLDRGDYSQTGAKIGASLVLGLIAIPGLVIGSVVFLVATLWPLFLGIYVEFGILPWNAHREEAPIPGLWWLLNFLWLIGLVVGVGLTWRRLWRGWRRLRAALPSVRRG
ncbi:hypothetical protein [Halovivax sp.]|uniref:hypothetical protein n=1 Tax=Halovivax sp. TaxID=1935978 RepID=UPI0025C21A89|nr:hypothetical protein [Halovivax sp.]